MHNYIYDNKFMISDHPVLYGTYCCSNKLTNKNVKRISIYSILFAIKIMTDEIFSTENK